MIILHRLNGAEITVNSELILYLESTPDTIVTFRGGDKIPVKESVKEVQNKMMIEFQMKHSRINLDDSSGLEVLNLGE